MITCRALVLRSRALQGGPDIVGQPDIKRLSRPASGRLIKDLADKPDRGRSRSARQIGRGSGRDSGRHERGLILARPPAPRANPAAAGTIVRREIELAS